MKFNVRTNFPQLKAAMRSNGAQVPFALSVALNKTAEEVVGVEQQVMERNFNRPTPFTVNSLFVKRSTKTDLKATVKPKDAGAGGRSASLWLDVGVGGGPRRLKGFERALSNAGILPNGMYAVPAAGAQLDVFGNWKRSELTRVLVDMRMAGTQAAAKRIGKLKAKDAQRVRQRASRYFLVQKQEDDLEPGIYERKRTAFGSAVRPIVIFVAGAPKYRRRIPFAEVGERVVRKSFAGHFERAYADALKSAKAGKGRS